MFALSPVHHASPAALNRVVSMILVILSGAVFAFNPLFELIFQQNLFSGFSDQEGGFSP